MAKLSGNELIDLIYNSREKAIIKDQHYLDRIIYGQVDDCALINGNEIISTDFGPLVGDDFKVSGTIAALNAISDIYVCGGVPKYAVIILALSNNLSNDDSSDLLSGIFEACADEGIAVVGGHTIHSEESLAGLTVIGSISSKLFISKGGAKEEDKIWISKPLGTGLVLRGYYNKLLDQEDYQKAISVMIESNGKVISNLNDVIRSIHSMTDVTGFGFIGHLSEMLDSNQGAILYMDAIPMLQSLDKLNSVAMNSIYIRNNYEYASSKKSILMELDNIYHMSLFDPQTNGPVLIVADKDLDLSQYDNRCVCVGRITSGNSISII